MCPEPHDGDIEEKLRQLSEDSPTLKEAKAIFEQSERYEDVKIVPSDDETMYPVHYCGRRLRANPRNLWRVDATDANPLNGVPII